MLRCGIDFLFKGWASVRATLGSKIIRIFKIHLTLNTSYANSIYGTILAFVPTCSFKAACAIIAILQQVNEIFVYDMPLKLQIELF